MSEPRRLVCPWCELSNFGAATTCRDCGHELATMVPTSHLARSTAINKLLEADPTKGGSET